MRPSVRQLKLDPDWVMMQLNHGPKHSWQSKMSEKKRNQGVAMIQSPDLNLNVVVGHQLCRNNVDLIKFKHRYKEEWDKIFPHPSERPSKSYSKPIQVFAAEGGSTSRSNME